MLLLIHNIASHQRVKLTSVDAAQGIAWLSVPGTGGAVLHVAACYIPPQGSHRRISASSPWDTLQQYIAQHSSSARSLLPAHALGDFNAKTGGLPESADDLSELQHALPDIPELAEYLQHDMPARKQTDTSSNAFGEQPASGGPIGSQCYVHPQW
jgi:hypothetical protein